MKKVILAAIISNEFGHALGEMGYELIEWENSKEISYQDFLSQSGNLLNIHGVITSNKLVLDEANLMCFPNLKWIARLGSGMEIIDTSFCDKHGIRYFSSPDGIANSVAEHVTGMLLSLLHKIHSSYLEIRQGHWIRELNRGVELEDLTVGIIGMGHTGTVLAKKLSVFTKQILVYDKYKTDISIEGIRQVSLEQLQDQADIISFHVPLNQETRNYYNEDFVSKMKKSHILINASRGAVVDTQVLLKHLASGKVKGACLDVLSEENEIESLLKQGSNRVKELLQYNVLMTPHIAGYSHNAIIKMSRELLDQIREIEMDDKSDI